jgi:hypothetical protein
VHIEYIHFELSRGASACSVPIFSSYVVHTEHHGRVVNTPASYSGVHAIKSRLGTGYGDGGFLLFFSVPPGKCWGNILN